MNIDFNIVMAFILSLIAGLSTGLGGCIALFVKNTNMKALSISLGFSAGVMIYISMVEILSEANDLLNISLGVKIGALYTLIAFLSGLLLIFLINKLTPTNINIYNIKLNQTNNQKKRLKLLRTGLLTAFVVALHNFPEGIVTFASSIHSLKLGIPIILAIALHNIPEGISVSMPIYYATNSKEKAFFYSFISGIAEPLGAIVGYIILIPFMTNSILGILYAVIAGIMVYISFNELLPTAREYGGERISNYGLISGVIFMAFTLWLFL